METVTIRDVLFSQVWDLAVSATFRSPQYIKALDYLPDAYSAAERANLRYDCATNIMSDNRLGELARPSNPSEWEPASKDDAKEYLARRVWGDAVRRFNVARAA